MKRKIVLFVALVALVALIALARGQEGVEAKYCNFNDHKVLFASSYWKDSKGVKIDY